MRIISWNVNGFRACFKKGNITELINNYTPDIICLQEMKAAEEDITDNLEKFKKNDKYNIHVNPAERKGYSGVSVFLKEKPHYVKHGFDIEGRILELGFDDFVLFNVYFPNGQKDDERLNYKLEFYAKFFEYTQKLRKQKKNIIICGDYNIAHNEIDLARPKQNENVSGFLRIERDWMDKIVSMKYVDTFRYFHKDVNDYSWWSYKFNARVHDIGWRIDYFFVTEEFLPNIKNSYILSGVLGSDHAPIVLEI